jgi:outer membrane receptor protein involved in Fe transport
MHSSGAAPVSFFGNCSLQAQLSARSADAATALPVRRCSTAARLCVIVFFALDLLLPAGLAMAADTQAAAVDGSLLIEEIRVIGRRDSRFAPRQSSSTAMVDTATQVSLNRTVGDWIETVPGVSLNGQGGLFQAYSVRGFSRWRVRTEVDGVPIITDRRAGNSASFVAPDLLASVRVDKSASSVLYGSGAMGGVVSLRSVRPATTALTLESRSNDGMASLSAIAGDGERRFAGISVRRASRATAADGTALDSGFRQASAVLGGVATSGDLEIEYRWLPGVARDVGKSSSLFPEQRISSYPEELHSVASVELRAGNHWLLRAYHHYQDWDADVERVGQRRNLTSYRANTVGGLMQRNLTLGPANGVAGLEWVGRRGVVITDREFSVDDELLLTQTLVDGDEDTLGAFLNQSWRRDRLALTAALRLDQLYQSNGGRDDSETQGSASLAADFDLSEDWLARAEVASGYRFPSLSERYFNGVTPRGEVRGNPALEPETRRSVEFGLEYAPPESAVGFRTAAYYSDLQNYIERFALTDTVVSYRNLDDARLFGAEVDLHLRAGDVEHRVSYQWQRGDDGAGTTLTDLNPPGWRYFLQWNAAPYSFLSDLQYRPERSDFGVEEEALEEAWIWNLTLGRPLGGAWAGELYLTNVLDETYQATADNQSPLQPGRALGIRIRWQPG